ncbi:hypothetical protein ACET3Z_006487 [Daucus carota]
MEYKKKGKVVELCPQSNQYIFVPFSSPVDDHFDSPAATIFFNLHRPWTRWMLGNLINHSNYIEDVNVCHTLRSGTY